MQYCGDIFMVSTESSADDPLLSPAVGSVVGLTVFPDHDDRTYTETGLKELVQAARETWAKRDASETSYICFPFDLKHVNGEMVHCEVGCTKIENRDIPSASQYLMVPTQHHSSMLS